MSSLKNFAVFEISSAIFQTKNQNFTMQQVAQALQL